MFSRRSLRLPIVLAILMIVLLLALTIGWVVLSVFGLLEDGKRAALYVTLLSAGTTGLVLVLVGTVIYLALSIKAINLTRRQSNFIDSVTHELKSPIASLKLYLQTLSLREVTAEERRGFYRVMLEDVERLDQLINHLLAAGQVEKEADHQRLETLRLDTMLAECAESVCVCHRVPPETICLDLAPCQLKSRRVDVDMIFRNLIDNAVKYGGDPPQVEIQLARRENGWAQVSIRDNGPGIPASHRRRIFGRFVRLGSELVRKRPGTGLGLYIVRTLVERLKGRIYVQGADHGAGTEFRVELAGAGPPDDAADEGALPTATQDVATPH